ncbi:MAG: GNAT family N-acetyltransferase, partial [Gemmatimonadota bacterium]
MHRSPRPIEIDHRPLATHAEFRQCVEIQRVTWGEGFGEVVPAGLLTVVERTGGLVAGAFEGDRMVGFVCGFAAYRDGEPIQWSHMLAVRPEARGRGVGRGLKLYQRQVALERGIRRIVWTFDPLQAINAHLNVNRLGAHIIDYVPDMYGSDTGSPLHAGQATDRFVV